MIDIRDQIIRERDAWTALSVQTKNVIPPIVMHEFVLRNGRRYTGQLLPANIRRRPMKQCFRNARSLALDRRHRGFRYCEGFARACDFSFMFHHGWVIDEFAEVIDPTLDHPHKYEYFGVWFPRNLVEGGTGWEALLANEVCYNVDFMCRFDTGFKEIVDRLRQPLSCIST